MKLRWRLSILFCMPVLVWQQYRLIICTKVSVCKPAHAPQVTEFHHLSVLVTIECLPDSLLPSLFPFLSCHSNMIYSARPPDLRGSAPYDSLASYAPVHSTVAGQKWCLEITYFTHKNEKQSPAFHKLLSVDTDTHTQLTALSGPLSWSLKMTFSCSCTFA